MRRLYTLGFYSLTPFLLLRWLWRSRTNPAYRQRLNERFGRSVTHDKLASIWVHAVSVGETIAAAPLIKALIAAYPNYAIVVTSTTPTGAEQVRKLFGDSVYHYYFPLDLPGAVRRFILTIKPRLTIIMETELWPNLLAKLQVMRIPTLLANARLSQKSAQNYQKFAKITRPMLQSLTQIATQSELDAKHFIAAGAANNHVVVAGNIKFDMQLPADIHEQATALRQQWSSAQRPTLIAASTHEGEDKIILDAFANIKAQCPTALLILVPRHPERFNKVTELCQQQFTTVRRSTNDAINKNTAVLVGDTMGELRLLYATADAAFVGGSFVPVGGHNFIEPAALGLPLLSGPHLHNFVKISELLSAANALSVCHNADELAANVTAIFQDKNLNTTMGQAALAVATNNRGALNRHLEIIRSLIQK